MKHELIMLVLRGQGEQEIAVGKGVLTTTLTT